MTTGQLSYEFGSGELNNVSTHGASIVCLFFWSGPFTITGVVSFIIVYPVQRASWWAFANIGQENFKIGPTFTYFDASTPVTFIIWVVCVVAAAMHRHKCFVKGMFFSSLPLSIDPNSFYTTAGFGEAGSKDSGSNFAFISAIALAKPLPFSMFVYFNWLKCNQFSKSYICDIYRFGHRSISSGSKSSSGVGVAASIPLRIVALRWLQCLL